MKILFYHDTVFIAVNQIQYQKYELPPTELRVLPPEGDATSEENLNCPKDSPVKYPQPARLRYYTGLYL